MVKFKFKYNVEFGRRNTQVEVSMHSVDEIKKVNGITWQNHSDPDVKALGKKYAVKDAIRNLPKDERRQVWSAFFTQLGIKARKYLFGGK